MEEKRRLSELGACAGFSTRTLNCRGCDNNCLVMKYDFGEGNVFYSGNRCEKVFSNGGAGASRGVDVYELKRRLLFDRASVHPEGARRIGVPRVLNMFEDFPFWHSLLTGCGFDVVLSPDSTFAGYESTARMVMSDNLCFPAKLVHAHIAALEAEGVERIFFPLVVYGPKGDCQNSYNCPIVSGYGQVVKIVQECGIPVDTPVISMKDTGLLRKACVGYLQSLGVTRKTAMSAFGAALQAQDDFGREIASACRRVYESRKGLVIMLAGRPYHTDALIQHKVSEMIASMGVDVMTDDLVRDMALPLDDVNFLSQWTYTNRILKAAKWCASEGRDVQFVEFTSFGCGPDAFLTDAIRDLLMRHGKCLTLIKLDDINNVGSMKLRCRSLIDSLKMSPGQDAAVGAFRTTPPFRREDKTRTILIPFFTPFLSPLIPHGFISQGYRVVTLPMSTPESGELGLKYANNEVCYPATLVIGDIIKALRSGEYDLHNTAVAMTQTGGQCRASNYLGLIKKALVDAGYSDIPVISFNFSSGLANEQPGFEIDWLKLIPVALYGLLLSDCLSKMYYATVAREKVPGTALRLKEKYLKKAADLVDAGRFRQLLPLTEEAAREFDAAADDRETKKVGIVGEIYLKFNPYAHRYLCDWLIERGVEVVPPVLTDFFVQYFVNRKVNKSSHVEHSSVPEFAVDGVYRLISRYVRKFNAAASTFRYFMPIGDISDEAERASKILSLNIQFGEGWLLPGEIATYAEEGVMNVLSLQPFGCIANHIVSRGVEKKVKQMYPGLNYLSIDFDGGVSRTNIINRMLLFMDNMR